MQTQRAAVKMLHDRIMLLVQYVTQVIQGKLEFWISRFRSALTIVSYK